jgi:hypothetical protein
MDMAGGIREQGQVAGALDGLTYHALVFGAGAGTPAGFDAAAV